MQCIEQVYPERSRREVRILKLKSNEEKAIFRTPGYIILDYIKQSDV